MPSKIGTLNEHRLHSQLKDWLAEPGDLVEQDVDGYRIDILRGELLIEIQTGNFTAIRRKLAKLLETHEVLLVHPIAREKWILRQTRRGRQVARRKSPKKGRFEHVFDELVRMPHVANHPNFRLLVLLTQQEEVWRDDGKGSWRRGKWSIADRHLLKVTDSVQLDRPADYLNLIPDQLERPFTHKSLAKAMKTNVRTSTKLSYCLRKMGLLETVGKQGNTLLLAPVDTIVS
jgi:hypothetical protein